MKIINLTPHQIDIYGDDGNHVLSVEPSGTIARLSVQKERTGTVNGFSLYRTVLGPVENLPEPRPDTMYIVSGLVREACPDRTDLWQPGELLRDEAGRPIGCIGLSQ